MFYLKWTVEHISESRPFNSHKVCPSISLADPGRAPPWPPLRVQILLSWHKKCSKSNRLGRQRASLPRSCRPLWKILDPESLHRLTSSNNNVPTIEFGLKIVSMETSILICNLSPHYHPHALSCNLDIYTRRWFKPPKHVFHVSDILSSLMDHCTSQ